MKRWDFLSRWCSVLFGRIRYKKIERDGDVWTDNKFRLQVDIPKRSECCYHRRGFALNEDDETEFKLRMQRVREALALLAAVAHVDKNAWKILLREKCGVMMGKAAEEKYEKEIPVKILLKVDLDVNKKRKEEGSLGLDLLLFFDTLHRTEPSADYVRALASIAKMDGNMKPLRAGMDVKIPVQVLYLDSHDTKTAAARLQNVWEAEKVIADRWAGLENEPVLSGSLRCTFVLEPMIAEFGYGEYNAKLVKIIEKLVVENVRFAQLDFYPSRTRNTGEIKRLTQFMTSVFRGSPHSAENSTFDSRRGSDRRRQLQAVNLKCDDAMESLEFGAVLSALLFNSTTDNVSVGLNSSHSDDDEVARKKWMWLACGAFSKRACAPYSLTITDINGMSVEGIEAFKTVAVSVHPEEDLCGCSRGLIEERLAIIRSGAKVRWEQDEDGQPRKSSRALTLPSEMSGIVFSDNGESEFVNVVIPGFGHCLIQRGDLVIQDSLRVTSDAPRSLTIQFKENDEDDTNARLLYLPEIHSPNDVEDNRESDNDVREQDTDDMDGVEDDNEGPEQDTGDMAGLSRFIETIGSSLKNLVLDGPRPDTDENLILRSCPQLETLSLCGGLVDVEFCFLKYRARNQPVPELSCNWHDVASFSAALSDPDNPVGKCVRQLCVQLKNVSEGWRIVEGTHNPPGFELNADMLLEMLEKNTRMEYFEIIAPIEYDDYADIFNRHHLKPTEILLPSSLGTSIAFLSVVSSLRNAKHPNKKTKASTAGPGNTICELDRYALSNIFEFAAVRVARQVYFQSESGWDYDSEDEHWLVRI